jgi:hypothetical protein
MKQVLLDRNELLEIVRENRDKHVADYKEAVADYKKAVVNLAKENLALARTGRLEDITRMKNAPGAPVSYEDSYNRAIRMLELSVEDQIELEEQVFNQLVLDEWHWKQSFTIMNSTYKGMA